MIVGFTGHRPDKLGGYTVNPTHRLVRRFLRVELKRLMASEAISGMALGVDQIAAEVCIELNIPFIAAIPHDNQDSRWPPYAREHYRDLLKRCVRQVEVSSGPYSHEKMDRRNHWIVNHCDVLVAVWNGSSGGTGNTVLYASKVGRKMVQYNPDTKKITRVWF